MHRETLSLFRICAVAVLIQEISSFTLQMGKEYDGTILIV
jgi:hypothetical protein